MKVNSLKSLLLLMGTVAGISVLGGCDQADQDSGLDIVQGRLVTAQDNGPEKLSTVGLSGCTGTIIARDLVLTAAHCYQNSVQGGYVLFGMKFNGRERKIIKIVGASVNPDYTDASNDVALLKLASDIPVGYQTVKLLPPSIPLNPGDTVRQAGYGSDNSWNSFGTLRTVDSRYQGRNRRGSLSVRNGSTAACSGDSGGPLYVQKNGEWYTAGITSTAYMDAQQRCTGGNEYASVSQNYDLILGMARRLTGRENPLGDSSPAPQPQPEPNNPGDQGPGASFTITRELLQNGGTLNLEVKNTSGRALTSCRFTLSPIRSFWGFYQVEYDVTTSVPQLSMDQTLDLNFQDPYAYNGRLGEIESYSLKGRCQR